MPVLIKACWTRSRVGSLLLQLLLVKVIRLLSCIQYINCPKLDVIMQFKQFAIVAPLLLATASAVAIPVVEDKRHRTPEKDNDDIWLWKKAQLEKDNDDIWLWKKNQLEKDNDDIWLWKKGELEKKEKDNDDIWLWKKRQAEKQKRDGLEKDNDDIWLWKKGQTQKKSKLEKDNDDIWLW
ncbi:hypothetical protein GGR57DRAFT_474023 [Xylariaceae sp. FL1272]|nr:hypothetical protein GGR57DRAFT_474023 [Xylariaceae sp. FL1272]